MPPLNFDDTLGVSEAIAAAGAPRAAAHYTRFPRTLNAIFTELRVAQDERLAFSEGRSARRADLARRAARMKFKDDREAAEEQLAEHDGYTNRRMSEFAERSAAGDAKLETDGRCAIGVQEFVKDTLGQGKRLRDVPLPNPAVMPAGIAATVEVKRAELIAIGGRRADVENRPSLASDLKAAMSKAIASRAEEGRPRFDPRIRGGADPSRLELSLVRGGPPGAVIGDGGRSFFVWLLADQIEAHLHSLVDEADLTGAMADAEQAAALAALDAERLAIEREEEALIRMAEAQGMNIARRADASPMAVLMVEVR